MKATATSVGAGMTRVEIQPTDENICHTRSKRIGTA
jgi:hypothetical protein